MIKSTLPVPQKFLKEATFNGPMSSGPKFTILAFTDRKSHTTFAIRRLRDFRRRLKEVRKSFGYQYP